MNERESVCKRGLLCCGENTSLCVERSYHCVVSRHGSRDGYRCVSRDETGYRCRDDHSIIVVRLYRSGR